MNLIFRAITRQELSCKITLFSLWSAYTLLSCLLYVWMKTEVDVIEGLLHLLAIQYLFLQGRRI